MVVDDERLVRWSLRQKCEEWGYLVIEAKPAKRRSCWHSASLRPGASRRALA